MSGYQQLPQGQYPAYNPAYPQPQGYPAQQGYAPPPYQAAPPYQPSYAPQPAAPIVVNVTSTQNQQATQQTPIVQPTRVFLGRTYDNDVGPALIIFIIGWFTCFVWGAGFIFIRSKNRTAKMLGIASVVMFFVAIAVIVIAVAVSVAAANAAINAANNYNYHTSYSTSYTISISSFSNGYYAITVPYGYTSASVSSYGSNWAASSRGYYTDASGYSGTTCGTGCPLYYQNVMALVGKCNSYGSPMLIGNSYTYWSISGCSYIYLGYNDLTSNSHTGYISVTVTWNP